MRKHSSLFIAAAAVLVLAAGGMLYLQSDSTRRSVDAQAGSAANSAPMLPSQAQTPTAHHPRSTRYDPIILTRPGSRDAVAKAFPYFTPEQLLDGRSFISFDTAAARSLQKDDQFAIALPGTDHPSVARIQDVAEFEGMKRYTGVFVGTDAEENHFSLTLSADGSYATGQFTHGPSAFAMESKNDAGWFNSAATEGRKLIDGEQAAMHGHAP